MSRAVRTARRIMTAAAMPPYGTTAAAEEVEARRRAEVEGKPIAEGGRESAKTPKPPSEEPDPNDGYIQG
jgi:hypothetical protein